MNDNLKKCIRMIQIINSNPADKQLLKQELRRDFDDATIRAAKKHIKGKV